MKAKFIILLLLLFFLNSFSKEVIQYGSLKVIFNEYDYIKILYKNKVVFFTDKMAFIFDINEIDTDKDKKGDVLIVSFKSCDFWKMCPSVNIFMFKNQKKPRIFILIGYITIVDKDYIVSLYPNDCVNESLYIHEEGEFLDMCSIISDNYYLIYKINNNQVELNKKAMEDLIKSNLNDLRRLNKHVYVFENNSYLEKIPEIKDTPKSEFVEFYLKEKENKLKMVDLSIGLKNYKGNSLITLYTIATYIDNNLAKQILEDFFIFENEKVKKQFMKTYGKPNFFLLEENGLKEIKY